MPAGASAPARFITGSDCSLVNWWWWYLLICYSFQGRRMPVSEQRQGAQHGAVVRRVTGDYVTTTTDALNSEQPVEVLVDGGVLHVRVQLGGLHPWRRVDLELVLPPDVHRVPDRQ